jgi:hypothetical protein
MFAPIPGGPHGTISNDRRSPNFARIVTNMAQGVSLIVSFHLHYVSSPLDHFLPKELHLKFSLQFLAGDMQLVGWRYFDRKW